MLFRSYTNAVKYLRKAAEQGYPPAQYNLGSLIERGIGFWGSMQEHDAEGAKWHRKAAEQGYPPAQTRLGDLYKSGQGVPQDDVEAAKWYRKAIKGGSKMAQEKLEDPGGRRKEEQRKYAAQQAAYNACWNKAIEKTVLCTLDYDAYHQTYERSCNNWLQSACSYGSGIYCNRLDWWYYESKEAAGYGYCGTPDNPSDNVVP